jgi:hypothetical protein
MATTRDKRKLSQFRISMGMPVNIKPSDVIPIVNNAWKHSFARVGPNKRAIARRGWTPLNRGLLKCPEVLKTRVRETTPATPTQEIPTEAINMSDATSVFSDLTNTTSSSLSSSSLPKALNLTSGYAGDFVTGMLQFAIKNEKNAENLEKRYKDGRTLKESLLQQENKRFTAGSLFKANRVAIDSELLEYMEEKELESVRKQQATINKHTTEYLTNKGRAEIVFATKKQPEVLLIAELKAVVKWKKRKGDAAIPSTKSLLLQRYVETINRPDLTLAQFLEDSGSQTAI